MLRVNGSGVKLLNEPGPPSFLSSWLDATAFASACRGQASCADTVGWCDTIYEDGGVTFHSPTSVSVAA